MCMKPVSNKVIELYKLEECQEAAKFEHYLWQGNGSLPMPENEQYINSLHPQ